MGNDLELIKMFMLGILFGFVIAFVVVAYLMSTNTSLAEKSNTLSLMCNNEFGKGNWNFVTKDGYWRCMENEESVEELEKIKSPVFID